MKINFLSPKDLQVISSLETNIELLLKEQRNQRSDLQTILRLQSRLLSVLTYQKKIDTFHEIVQEEPLE